MIEITPASTDESVAESATASALEASAPPSDGLGAEIPLHPATDQAKSTIHAVFIVRRQSMSRSTTTTRESRALPSGV
ncbi:MAG TPA: hypothetical protein VLM85_11385 [Polyangiaceae bacterium]|nr:hypothetical protein [Polyangiaceae bacterium]